MTPKRTQTLLDHLDASVKAAVWLTAADAAAVELARLLARQIMSADVSRETSSLAKQLNDVLQSLGLNVAGRTGKAEAPKPGEVNPLAELRIAGPTKTKAAQPTAKRAAKPRANSRKVR